MRSLIASCDWRKINWVSRHRSRRPPVRDKWAGLVGDSQIETARHRSINAWFKAARGRRTVQLFHATPARKRLAPRVPLSVVPSATTFAPAVGYVLVTDVGGEDAFRASGEKEYVAMPFVMLMPKPPRCWTKFTWIARSGREYMRFAVTAALSASFCLVTASAVFNAELTILTMSRSLFMILTLISAPGNWAAIAFWTSMSFEKLSRCSAVHARRSRRAVRLSVPATLPLCIWTG